MLSGIPSTATIAGVKLSRISVLLLGVLLFIPGQAEVRLDQIRLPPGFRISIYAKDVENARQMVRAEQGTIFVGSRHAGKVWALSDTDNDQRADKVRLIDSGLNMPSGVEFRDSALYVGAIGRILRYDSIESSLDHPSPAVVVSDALPDNKSHGWKYLRFGPDGKLYIPVGAPCNVCDQAGFGEIRHMNADGSDMTTYARGVRNSVGLAFHPENHMLWFTDNGRDHLGDDLPADELNHAPKPGMHFGFPYCHQGDLLDEEYGKGRDCGDYTPPVARLDPHGAALGLAFYTGNMFPAEYTNRLFIVQHGSWNRSEKVGYRILSLRVLADGTVVNQEVFASGWLQGERAWGRPNDVMVMPDGALLVSDDYADVIYRISYAQ